MRARAVVHGEIVSRWPNGTGQPPNTHHLTPDSQFCLHAAYHDAICSIAGLDSALGCLIAATTVPRVPSYPVKSFRGSRTAPDGHRTRTIWPQTVSAAYMQPATAYHGAIWSIAALASVLGCLLAAMTVPRARNFAKFRDISIVSLSYPHG